MRGGARPARSFPNLQTFNLPTFEQSPLRLCPRFHVSPELFF